MLINIYCLQDEKDSPKHVCIIYLSCTWILKIKRTPQLIATAALSAQANNFNKFVKVFKYGHIWRKRDTEFSIVTYSFCRSRQ